MKVSFLLILFILTACDSRTRRTSLKIDNDEDAIQNALNGDSGRTTTPGNSGIIPSGTVGSNGLTQEYAHCDLDNTPFRAYDNYLGNVSLCQSKGSPLNVVLRTENSFNSTRRICIIGTSRFTDNSSQPIGDAFCSETEAGKSYTVTLNILSANNQFALNGAMVLFEDKISEYFLCIQLTQAGSPDAQYVCDNFINAGQFIDFNFTSY